MTEQQFERRARAWLELGPSQAPAGSVEAALTAIETLPQVRPAGSRSNRRFVYLAAAAALAAALGAAFMIGTQPPQPPTPTPMPSAPVSLPDIAALAAAQPPATIRIERSVGPADAPVSNSTTTNRIELGPVRLIHGYFVSFACLGPGDMIVSVVEGGRTALSDIPSQCDGGRLALDFPLQVANNAGYDVNVVVTVADGASWRLALGEYLLEAETAPDFADPTLTVGWHFVQDVPAVRGPLPPGTGPGSSASPGGAAALLQIPQATTRIGIFVQCQGASNVTVTANDSFATDVECREDGTARVEFPVIGGEELAVRAVSDRLAWIRLSVESDGEIATTYPTAPPLPDAVARTPYANASPDFLAMGTLGSNRQGLIPVRGAQTGLAGNDFVAVVIPDETSGTRLDLFSVSEATVINTLAEVPGPGRLVTGVVDAVHGHVFYLIGRADGTAEYRRVGLDGTGDRDLVALPGEGISLASNLARDASTFVIEFCRDTTTCLRHIVDAATLELRTVDVPALPVCRIDAVIAGQVIESSGGPCGGAETPYATWATPLDGGERRLLVEGAVERYVVETTTGSKLVFSTGWTPAAGKRFEILDVASGDTEVLVSYEADSPRSALAIGPARLPAGWILLAGLLNEYPAGRLALGAAPLLIHVETGEQIELVNLPHRQP